MSADAVTGLPVHNGKTGELLMTIAGERPCRVSRRKLRKLFSEGLTIQYGKEFVEAVEEGEQVVAVFADGTRVVGDVLVGCDGARSRVREVLCGEEAARVTTVPVSMINFTQMYTAEQALHVRSLNPLFVTSIHPDLRVMFWLSSRLSFPNHPGFAISAWLQTTEYVQSKMSQTLISPKHGLSRFS